MECDRAPYPRGRYPETLSGLGDFHAHAHSPLTPMRIVLLSPKIPVALHQLSGFQHQQLSLHQASCPITHISISIGITNTREDAQQVLGVFDRILSVLTSTPYTHCLSAHFFVQSHKPKIFNSSFSPLNHSSFLLHNLSP